MRSKDVFRVGIGYDVHRLVKGRALVLGGVPVRHSLGLLGHSDADVLIHAIIDAILGALGKGDIGQHFPDSDLAYKDVSSLSMLKAVMEWVRQDGYRVHNLDTTIIAERPKLATFIPEMKERLSEILKTPKNGINVKATTTEGLGFCGREEGITAHAVVSLVNVTDETPIASL